MKRKGFLKMLIVCGLITSCSEEIIEPVQDGESTILESQELGVEQEIVDMLDAMYLNTQQVSIAYNPKIDGTKEKGYLVEKDLFLTKSEIVEMYEAQANNRKKGEGLTNRHYRSRFLVDLDADGKRELKVFAFRNFSIPEGQLGLSSRERKALRSAIGRYNNLNNLDITFRLKFSNDPVDLENADIWVLNDPLKPANTSGANARFPKRNGNPGEAIKIFNLDDLNDGLLEAVFTHELGHTIGLQHTDYYTLESCEGRDINVGNPNPANGVSIDSTPEETDLNSIMLACLDRNRTDGRLSRFDKKALRTLY